MLTADLAIDGQTMVEREAAIAASRVGSRSRVLWLAT
jgi:hypothetical protein